MDAGIEAAGDSKFENLEGVGTALLALFGKLSRTSGTWQDFEKKRIVQKKKVSNAEGKWGAIRT